MSIQNPKKNEKFFGYAKKMSVKSQFHRAPFGCVVIYKNKVIGTGTNSTKSNPVQAKYNQYRTFDTENGSYIRSSVHAEINALYPLIDNMNIDWKKVDLYIYRKCKSREHGMARPCPACMQLIKDLGIKNIHYTTDDGFAHEMI